MYEQYVNSDEQYMNRDFFLCTVNPYEITVHAQEEKKKKNLKRKKKL